MPSSSVPGANIEVLREIPRGAFKHALFDFDGTISLLRQGWEGIMGPVMLEMITGGGAPWPGLEQEVAEFIEETTGIQTIIQMEGLAEMVRKHGRVKEVLDAHAYKHAYNERLLVPVRERLARLKTGALTREEATVRGSVEFVQALAALGLAMYIFSGTDRDDVRHEAQALGVAAYFREIWGALPSVEEYSKEKVLKEIIAAHDLHGSEVLIVGDGPVEIRNARENGCVGLGVCSNEVTGRGWNDSKRARLTKAGADLLVPDFAEHGRLIQYLFPTAA